MRNIEKIYAIADELELDLTSKTNGKALAELLEKVTKAIADGDIEVK